MDICWLINNKIIVLEIEKALQWLKQKDRGRPIFLEATTKPNLLQTTAIMLLLEMTSKLIQNYKHGKGFDWKSGFPTTLGESCFQGNRVTLEIFFYLRINWSLFWYENRKSSFLFFLLKWKYEWERNLRSKYQSRVLAKKKDDWDFLGEGGF